MPRSVQCLEVLIASPGDVLAERQIIVECIEDWNAAHSRAANVILQPRRWELDVYPEMGDRPQAIINKQIVDGSDILFGVFWHRVGTPTGLAQSGTIEEIGYAVRSQKPVFLYFSQAPVPMDHDSSQLASVREYKGRMRLSGVAFDFSNVHEFRRLVSRHLAMRMSSLGGSVVSDMPNLDPTSATATVTIGAVARVKALGYAAVYAAIENNSPKSGIFNWSCELTLPRACLASEPVNQLDIVEIQSTDLFLRKFRAQADGGGALPPIGPGEQVMKFFLLVGRSRHELSRFPESEVSAAVRVGVVSVEVTINGRVLKTERRVAELLTEDTW